MHRGRVAGAFLFLPRYVEESDIDKFIRFVAHDSLGQCFLWSMHWGEAGYGCRIARLTEAETAALYAWSTRPETQAASHWNEPFLIADQAPASASFKDPENALRFFSRNGDPVLERWARIMFGEIQKCDACD